MFGKHEHEHFILWYTYLHQIIIIAHFYFSLSRLKNTQPFFQLALEWIKLLLRRTKRGKKDPEMTKETAVHPFLVVCNKLSCQYHWNLICRVSSVYYIIKYGKKSYEHLTMVFISSWCKICEKLKSIEPFLGLPENLVVLPFQPIWQHSSVLSGWHILF